jgi:hypothetical protein
MSAGVRTSPRVCDARTSDRSPDIGAIRQQAFDIDHQVGDIEIMIEAIFEQLDEVLSLTPGSQQAVKVINCFATCALRNAALIKSAGANVLTLTSEGGAA